MTRLLKNYRGQRPPQILTIEPWLREGDNPIAAAPNARGGRLVPWIVLRYGSIWSRLRHWGLIKNQLKGSLAEALESAKSIRQNTLPPRTIMNEAEKLELVALLSGLGFAGWGKTIVRPEILFSRARILYSDALVITMEMDKSSMETAHSGTAYQEIFRTYHELGKVVNQLAGWFRERGFGAQAGPAIGGDVNYVALAQEAGLGFIGRNGLLIGPHAGPRIRLAAVFTSVQNLPAGDLQETAWGRYFCKKCGACIRACPAAAIYQEALPIEGDSAGNPVYIDHTRCVKPFSRQFGCSICIKVCPFSQSGWEKIKMAKNKEQGVER